MAAPRVLDLTPRSAAVQLEVVVSPAYELLVTLSTMLNESEWEGCDLGPEWFADVRKKLPADLRRDLQTVIGSPKLCVLPSILLTAGPPPADVPEFIRALEEVDPAELYIAMFGCHRPENCPAPSAMVRAAAHGGDNERRRLADAVNVDDEDYAVALRNVALSDPAAFRDGFVSAVRRFHESVFAKLEPQVMPVLRRDAAAKRAAVRGLGVRRAVELATNGIDYPPEPEIRKVVLAPQAAMRPWVMMAENRDTKLFLYPVAAESLEEGGDAPPQRLVALCKALADPQRLRLLRRLASGPMSLQQVADHLGCAKSTAHHHGLALRVAGLVRVAVAQENEYSLREDLVPDVAGLLDAYIHGSTTSSRSRDAR